MPHERLTALSTALTEDLDRGVWAPGPLERTLAARLLVACAGDGQFTPVRLREILWEGSVALTHAGGGRLARLLSELHEVTSHAGLDAGVELAGTARLLEQVAREPEPPPHPGR
ncbi:hypothetical protein ACFY94_25730 [Streptomyces griseorubiginosus]|uniref:hypothetical protein n=1 Tax=Streptomyces griseorubiginosus TaxID=67304 RepID=UPI0036EDAFEE